MAERKTGVFPLDYFDNREGDFSDQEIVELLTKTIEYLKGGDVPSFSDRALKIRFMDYKEFFDKNMASWQKRAENLVQFKGTTESEPNRTESEPNRTESDDVEPNRNQIGYVNVNVNVNDNDITKEKNKQKERKESFKSIVEGFTSSTALREALFDFADMRKKIRSPLTEKAMKLNLSKLSQMTTDEDVAVKIVNQSIENGWKGFYPLKEEKPKTRQEELHQLYEKYKKEEEESGQKRHDDPDEFSFSDIFQLESGEL